METRPVRYVTTSDGYNVAYTDSGAGRSLVLLPFGFTHARLSWSAHSSGPHLHRLEQRFRLIHYDGRGQGLSQRGLPPDRSLDDLQLDLQAVLTRLNLERPILFGDHISAHVAVRYAAENPENVAALILTRARSSLVGVGEWLRALMQEDWDHYLRIQLPDDTPGDQLQEQVKRLKASINQDDAIQQVTAAGKSDITHLLPRLQMPALLLYPREQPWIKEEEVARVVALIPNSRLAVLSGFGVWGDPDEAAAAIDAFVAELPGLQARDTSDQAGLSARETEVLRLLAAGKSNQQIADELVISPTTVAKHVTSILTKTESANRAQAAVFAHQHGLV